MKAEENKTSEMKNSNNFKFKSKVVELNPEEKQQLKKTKFLSPNVKKENISNEDLEVDNKKSKDFVIHKSKYQDKNSEVPDILPKPTSVPSGVIEFKETDVQNFPDLSEMDEDNIKKLKKK